MPYGTSAIVLPDEAEKLESLVLSKLSLKTIDLNKYVNPNYTRRYLSYPHWKHWM